MAVKKGGLGPRDLSFFISSETSSVPAALQTTEVGSLTHLPLHSLIPGKYQPRKEIDPEILQELADSIRAQGVIQPIIVRPQGEHYEIIAGERRSRAAALAGLTQIPVVIKHISDQAAMAMALIENIQREDLNPIEEAIALQRLLDEFGLTHEQIAKEVGKSRATVSNLLRILSLEEEVKTYLMHGDLELGHAKVLLALKGLTQLQAAHRVIEEGLSVRDTEKLIQRLQHNKSQEPFSEKPADPDVQRLERTLSDRLGASVRLSHQPNGKGKLVIRYNSLDELDGILEHIK